MHFIIINIGSSCCSSGS